MVIADLPGLGELKDFPSLAHPLQKKPLLQLGVSVTKRIIWLAYSELSGVLVAPLGIDPSCREID